MDQLRMISTAAIRPNPENPRRKMSAEDLDELTQSIKAVGLLQPITVREKILGHSDYEIVCGHRRFEAARSAGLTEVPCIVRELTDEQAYEVMVTENLQRKDIDPFDESAAFAALKDRGYDVQALADKFGKSTSYIYGRLRLTNLLPEFVERYEKGTIQFSHCAILARVERSLQQTILQKYYSGGYYDISEGNAGRCRAAVMDQSIDLDHQYIDMADCENCVHNTKSGAIFPEMCAAKCTNIDCFTKKYIDSVYHCFVEIRDANPDFFILEEEYRSNLSSYDEALREKLRADGFTFKKAHSWDYVTDKDRKNKFDHMGKAACFIFGFEGFKFVDTSVRKSDNTAQSKPRPYKNDWQLDRYVKNKEMCLASIKREMVDSGITALTDEKLNEMSWREKITKVIRAAVYHMAQASSEDCTVFGIETGDIDEDNRIEKLRLLTLPELTAALAKLIIRDTLYMEYPTDLVEELFPEQFKVSEDEIQKAYIDKCRNEWHDYGEVTDEMVLADLAEREKKNEK